MLALCHLLEVALVGDVATRFEAIVVFQQSMKMVDVLWTINRACYDTFVFYSLYPLYRFAESLSWGSLLWSEL